MADETEVKEVSEEEKVFNTFGDAANLVASLFSEETITFREKVKETKVSFSNLIIQIPKNEENEEVILQLEELSSLLDSLICNIQVPLEESARILSGAMQIAQKINPDNDVKEEEENN